MPPYPAVSPTTSSSSASPSATSLDADVAPSADPRLSAVIIVLGIVAAFLITFIVYITLRVKKREVSGDTLDPSHGTVMHQDHPAAHITPFGAAGPQSGGRVPRFGHTPGQDMRIAIRRPDGAWHFADSRTPFRPSGVSEIDVLPSPISTVGSRGFPPPAARRLPSTKEKEASYLSCDDTHNPPPPAYYREPCRDYLDSR